MATIKSLESRIVELERQIARLSARFSVPRKPRKNWLSSMAGCMAGYPEFEEVVRLGREWRESFRPDEELDDSMRADEPSSGDASRTGAKRRKTKRVC